MITNDKFKTALNSKVGYLTRYYVDINNVTPAVAYSRITKTYVYKILCDRNSRLFLESVNLIRDALEIEFTQGSEKAALYLKENIGG
jgi:hypothetical protein